MAKVNDTFGTIYDYEGLDPALELLLRAKRARDAGEWEDIGLNIREEYGSFEIEVYGKREETDAERKNREKREADFARRTDEIERENYERLKKKFEGK